MDGFEEICWERQLSREDTETLKQLAAQLPLIAELTNADVFLDLRIDEEKALVAAQSRPKVGNSVYRGTVLGAYALRENEPAVFHAFEDGIPVCDLKAVTQEGRTVRQNAAPVFGADGKVIAVLIREKDISSDLQQQRKYEALARRYEEAHDPAPLGQAGTGGWNEMREMHHRIKNDLQLVAGSLRFQARKTENAEAREVLQESVGKILSIAAIHDIITKNIGSDTSVGSRMLTEKLCGNLRELIPPDTDVVLLTEGDDIRITEDQAASVAMIITELVTNAVLHAFPEGRQGTVTVSFRKGSLFHTAAVTDDGTGFEDPGQEGMGLGIVRMLVRDKLDGRLHISTGAQGTKVSFDFRNK